MRKKYTICIFYYDKYIKYSQKIWEQKEGLIVHLETKVVYYMSYYASLEVYLQNLELSKNNF